MIMIVYVGNLLGLFYLIKRTFENCIREKPGCGVAPREAEPRSSLVVPRNPCSLPSGPVPVLAPRRPGSLQAHWAAAGPTLPSRRPSSPVVPAKVPMAVGRIEAGECLPRPKPDREDTPALCHRVALPALGALGLGTG